MKKKGGIAGAGIVIAAIILLFNGGGLGLGGGGNGSGSFFQMAASDNEEKKIVSDTDQTQNESVDTTEIEAATEIPNEIIVKIEEDQVTINGNPVKDAAELEEYLKEYNKDYRTFVLEDDYAIKETYEWVTGVFNEMGINLIETEQSM